MLKTEQFMFVYVFWGRCIGRGTIYIVVFGRCFDTMPIIILINQHHFAIHAETLWIGFVQCQKCIGSNALKMSPCIRVFVRTKAIEHIKIEFAMCVHASVCEREYKMHFFPGSPIQTNKRISCCATTMP